ncbi:hypothetical protein POKO110462_20025 [Pontibacter korlensis]
MFVPTLLVLHHIIVIAFIVIVPNRVISNKSIKEKKSNLLDQIRISV